MKAKRIPLVLMVLVLLVLLPATAAAAPGDIVSCTMPLNLSNSPGFNSSDPLLVADPSGVAHLFWVERLTGPPNAQPDSPDTLMYSRWEDGRWSQPLDIFFSPTNVFNKRINAPRAVIDAAGDIHLIWIGPDYRLYYSSAPAASADSAHSWRPQKLVARDHSGSQYGADVAYGPPNTLHILYAAGTGGGLPSDNRTNRAVSYIRSEDGGLSWSDPVDIFTFLDPTHGASNIRLYADPLGPLYATWTEWDNSGNGQAIYFALSPDGGHTWQPAQVLDRRVGDEYERDWTVVEKLDDGGLIALWEGGYRAYPQAQYSYNGGETWSRPIDTFYWLIADNGFAEFERDGSNRLHVFLPRRIREGYADRCSSFLNCTGEGNALWHSVWESQTNWREPRPVGDFMIPDIGGNYTSTAIVGGNRLLAAWFDYTSLELQVMECQIEDTAAVPARPWPATATPVSTPTPEQIAARVLPTATPPPPVPTLSPELAQTGERPTSSSSMIVLGLGPAILIVGGVLVLDRLRRRRQP